MRYSPASALLLATGQLLLLGLTGSFCYGSTTSGTVGGVVTNGNNNNDNGDDYHAALRRTELLSTFEEDQDQDSSKQGRRLLFQRIWNYLPQSKVTDMAAIDLDMEVIVKLLEENKFDEAERVYKEGGHVGSTAVLELVDPLEEDVPFGTAVTGLVGSAGDDVGYGTIFANAKAGETILLVEYATTINQDNHVGCQVGALPEPKVSGCFVNEGALTFPDSPNNKSYWYKYNKLEKNINLRTLLTLGLDVQALVENDTFLKFKDYYVTPLYADNFVTSALAGKNVQYFHGEIEFSVFGDKGKKEIAQMSMVLLTLWMTVVGSMEEAVDKCKTGTCETELCLERPGIHEWDSAVAYYAGSLVSIGNTEADSGNLLFNYADRRCEDMRTCGNTGTEKTGNSYINHEIFHWFVKGQREIQERYCTGATTAKNKIIELMTVPLIQGAIRYAHMVEGEMKLGDIEKHDAEAAGYALAVLPLVHHCNPEDAKIIYDNLRPQSPTSVDFASVKNAFERNYKCLKVKCSQIGGIHDINTGNYKPGTEPCNDLTVGLSEQQRNWALALGITFGTVLVIAILVCVIGKTERPWPTRRAATTTAGSDLQLQTEDAEMT